MTLQNSRHGVMAITLLVALPSHHEAQAQAHTSVTIGNYQYSLTDLDPNDGIAPSITWGTGTLTLQQSGSLSNGVGYGGSINTIASQSDQATYSGAIDAAHSLSYEGYTVSSGPGGLSTSANVAAGGAWYQSTTFSNSFVLSANTALTITALASSDIGVVVPAGSVVPLGQGFDNGYFDWAPIQSLVSVQLYAGAPSYVSSPTQALFQPGLRTYETTDVTDSKLLSITFTNATSSSLSSTLTASITSDGYAAAPLSMVPEASTMAQGLMGLIGLGIIKLRRRKGSGMAQR